MNKKSFNIVISVIYLLGVVATVILLLALDVIKSFNDFLASAVNFVIIFVNLIFGVFIIRKTLKKDNKKFLFEFFGSMIIRVIFLLIFVFISLTIFKLPVSPFIFSFFGFYLFALVFELSYLSRYIKTNFKVEA